MALFGKLDDNYTRTGKGTLTRWSNTLSLIPGLRNFNLGGALSKIPVISGTITAVLGYADTIIESSRWLLRGQFGSAATVLAAGAVGTTVNAFADTTWWIGNVASGVTTGATLGTHARALTETVIGSVTGALGNKPQVLSSYPAAIGSIQSPYVAQGPGKFAAGVSAQRGQNADEAYARYRSGEGSDHIKALESARQQQSAYARGA
ncbi:MAG: hypothetical protein ACOYNL_01430 [Rickettsiales bacterium]